MKIVALGVLVLLSTSMGAFFALWGQSKASKKEKAGSLQLAILSLVCNIAMYAICLYSWPG